MPSLKDIKNQIQGVKKTKQITKAMNMVSSAKLKGAQARIENFRPYADKFNELLNDVSSRVESTAHPLLEVHEQKKVALIVVMTSDRGLCGAYNMNIIQVALELAKSKQAEGMEVQFLTIGKKSRDVLSKQGFKLFESYTDVFGSLSFALAARIGVQVINAYSSQVIDDVSMVYGHFVNIVRQVPEKQHLLPVMPFKTEEEHAVETEYVYEPDSNTLLAELLPKFVNCQIYRGLLDTSASENAARMAAMDNATRNCDDLIGALTLLFNKTRQAAITAELMDIVGGVEALNG